MQKYSKFLYILLCFICNRLHSQLLDSSNKSQIQWHSSIEGGFNNISARFIDPWIYGGELQSELIQNETALLNPINSGGFIAQHDVTFNFKTKTNTKYELGLAWFQSADLQFSNDIFQLVFTGNTISKMYRLNPLQFTYNQFQTLNYTKHHFTSSQLKWSYGAGLCFGNRYINVSVHSGSVFDNRNAQQEVVLYLNAQTQASGLNQNTFFKPDNGIGITFHGAIQLTLKSDWTCNVVLDNLGVMRWQKQLYNKHWDTLMYYNGFNFNAGKLQSLNNPIPNFTEPSVNNQSAFYSILPFALNTEFVHVNTMHQADTRLGINYIYLCAYKPLFYITQYFGSHRLKPSASLGYGGFSTAQYGFGLNLNFNSIQFELQSKALQSFIFKSGPMAIHLNARLCYAF